MAAGWRSTLLGVALAAAGLAAADWLWATARLEDVVIASSLEPARVVADGSSTATITLRVTELGRPRQNDLLQLWLGSGSGLLRPTWVYTDAEGLATVTYQPNPASRYEPATEAVIQVLDTSIGRLIEVGKRHAVPIPLEAPSR